MNHLLIQAFLPGSPGPQELIVLFLVVLVLFGPKRLPEIARTIGKTLDQLRRGADDFKDQVMKIDSEPHDEDDLSSSIDDVYVGADDHDYIDADIDVYDETSENDEQEDRKEDDVV